MSDLNSSTPAPVSTPAPPAATPPVEAKPPEPKPEVDKSKMESLRLRSELKRHQDAIGAKTKELETATARLKTIEDAKASGKPAVALKALGFSDGQIAQLLVNGGEPEDKVANLEQQLAEMSQKLGDYQKRFDTAQSAREQEVARAKDTAIATQRKAFIEGYHAQEDKFPLLASTQNGALVLAEIHRHHEETGEILDPDVAASRVEQYLASSVPAQIDAFLARKPIREKIEAAIARLKAAETSGQPTEAPSASRTLETPQRQKWAARAPTLHGSMQRGTPPAANGKTSKDDVWEQIRAKFPGR